MPDNREERRERRKNALFGLTMDIGSPIITGFGLFLVYNVSSFFIVVIAIGILCFGFGCLGLEGLKKLLQENLNEVNQQS